MFPSQVRPYKNNVNSSTRAPDDSPCIFQFQCQLHLGSLLGGDTITPARKGQQWKSKPPDSAPSAPLPTGQGNLFDMDFPRGINIIIKPLNGIPLVVISIPASPHIIRAAPSGPCLYSGQIRQDNIFLQIIPRRKHQHKHDDVNELDNQPAFPVGSSRSSDTGVPAISSRTASTHWFVDCGRCSLRRLLLHSDRRSVPFNVNRHTPGGFA